MQLLPTAIQLREVLVTAENAREIVDAAIARISQNYSRQPELYRCFYRETAKKRQHFICVAEGVVDMYKTGYHQTANHDRVAISKGRRLLSPKRSDTLSVKVALEVSMQTAVKGKQVSGSGSFDIGVSKEATDLKSKTTATVKVRGGDVSKVCILVTGGQLYDSDVTEWQNGCLPTRAALVDMTLIPIYTLIIDEYARGVLTDYFNLKMKSPSNIKHYYKKTVNQIFINVLYR
jgi:hypothetical protein